MKNKFVKPTPEKKRREETLYTTNKPKDSSLHPTTETPAHGDDRGTLEEPSEGLGHGHIPPVKGPRKKKTRNETLFTAKNLRGFVPLHMTEPPMQKVDGDDVMRPVEVLGCDPNPPIENPVRRKLLKVP